MNEEDRQNLVELALSSTVFSQVPLDDEQLAALQNLNEYCVHIALQNPEVAKNPLKINALKDIMLRHPNAMVLVIGQFIDQLEEVSKVLNAPLIIGKTPNAQREELYKKFRNGEIRALVVSKVANFSIDLPDASVLIQLSGTYGSRQEEAQRLGRILRPKENNVSYFYTITTKDSLEETYSHNRQRFLTEQGYGYEIESWEKEELL